MSWIDFDELCREEDQKLPILHSTLSTLVLRVCRKHCARRKNSANTLWKPSFSFVEALGHNVVMLHSDQEPVVVQLLRAEKSRRVERTLVRHGPRGSRRSQGKIENENRLINSVCRAKCLSLENLLWEKLSSDCILVAWLIRHAAWSLTRYKVNNDGRTSFVRVFGKACTGRLEKEYCTSARLCRPVTRTGGGQGSHGRRAHLLRGKGVRKARSVHRVPPEERFVVTELKKVRGLPWNDVAQSVKATIVTHQDQSPPGHRRAYLTTKVMAKFGATPGCSGCVGLGPHTEACRASLDKAIVDEKTGAGVLGAVVGPIADHAADSSKPRLYSRSQRHHHQILLYQ